MLFGCRKMRGLMAASVYEALPEGERKALARHLAACESCRREAEKLANLAAAIPRTRPEPGFDLVPILRRRLAEGTGEPVRDRVAWRMPTTLAAAVVLLCLFGYGLWVGLPNAAQGERPDAQVVDNTPEASPVQRALAEAERFAAEKNFTAAYRALEQALEEHADDPAAGTAQLRLADLAFDDLQWYRQADEAYRDLLARYPGASEQSGRHEVIVRRRNMLDEARKDNYKPIYDLVLARRSAGNALQKYERLVAEHPRGYVADEAVREIVALVAPQDAESQPEAVVQALQEVRDSWKDGAAVAKLNLEIGNVAWRRLNDPVLAREAYEKAAVGPDPVLAQRAKDALDELRW
jgi:hypothetical protein